MSISPKDHPVQADHIEQEKVTSNPNDASKAPQTKLAAAASFLFSLLCGFGRILSFPFRKLYDFINRKQKSKEEDENTEATNAGSSSSSIQADTNATSESSVQPHKASPAEPQKSSLKAKVTTEITEKPTSNAPLEHKSTTNNIPPKKQAPLLQSPFHIDGRPIGNIFSNASDDDIIQLATTKMLIQHLLSKDNSPFRKIIDSPTSSTCSRDGITPPVITEFLSQQAPKPVTIPSDLQCGVPTNLLHDIQRLGAIQSPSSEDIAQVKKAIFHTANKMLHELRTSPDFAYIKQTENAPSPNPLDEIMPFILSESSLQELGFGQMLFEGSKPRNIPNTSKKDLALQHVWNLCRLSDISSRLTTMYISTYKAPIRIEISNYHPDLFNDKQVCAPALENVASAMFAYASEFTSSITHAISIIHLFLQQEDINNSLSKMVSGDMSRVDPERPEIQRLDDALERLESVKAQRCLSQYPDYMCRLISHMLDKSSQNIIAQDMNKIFQIMFEAKYGLVDPTDEQRNAIINDIKTAFRRCTREMKALLVMQHQEQALTTGIPQKEIQKFLDTDDLVPELFEPPIHLLQHNP